MIKAVLFDFDGVLTTDATGFHSICKYIANKIGIDFEKFKHEYYKYNKNLLLGKTTHEVIWEELCKAINADINISVLYDSFISTPIDTDMIKLAMCLKKKGYKIGMVTDNKTDRIEHIINHHRWNDLFDAVCISAQVGSGKDQMEIFQQALKQLQVHVDECVFIDNNEKNLIIPASMGMNVIYYDDLERDQEKLIYGLKNFGVSC